jgi:hypothetical protein
MPTSNSDLSLYQGAAAEQFGEAAPHIAPAPEDWSPETALAADTRDSVVLACPLPIEEVRHHLRKFLMVALEDGRQMYFRFYDPSVLNTFLPTCSREQLARFFGPIQVFWTDADDGAARLRYTLDDDGELVTETLPLAAPSRTPPAGAKLQPGR